MSLPQLTVEDAKIQLEEIVKPFQQEQNRRQKMSDFIKKCIQHIENMEQNAEKNAFFPLDELLKSKQAVEILEEDSFKGCAPIFNTLRAFADKQIDRYRLDFKAGLLDAAEKSGLPLKVDLPHFSFLKGIEGEVDFSNRKTTINELTLKSIDPKKILTKALDIKRKLYDSAFDPQKFINALLECYREILKKMDQQPGNPVPISELYTDYVWSLQSKTFLQNMDKGKFRGYSDKQFAVDLWRFFQSNIHTAEGGYRIKLTPGRNKVLWLIDQDGEKRQISSVQFIKTEALKNETLI